MTTRIILEAVSPAEMRLEAYRESGHGDWFWDREGNLRIQVAAADVWDERHAFLVALHELVEARLCFCDGIPQGAVDSFDAHFDEHFLHEDEESEPGDAPDSPYRDQHRKACLIEHLMAVFMGVRGYGEVK